MDVPANREWMYNRVLPDGVGLTNTFYEGVEFFILHACGLDQFKNEGTIRCPCLICDCRRSETPNEVMNHLYKKGFRKNYFYWTSHGEERPASIPITHPPPSVYGRSGCEENLRSYERMVMDAAGPSFVDNHEQSMEETPNDKTQAFFDLLSAAQSPLFEGCTSHSELSASLQLLTIKAEHNISQEAFNKIVDFCKEALPSDNSMPPNYYRQKKMVERLGLNYEKIDCCVNGCMLFYNHDINEKSCRFCKEERYTLKKTSCNKVKEVARKRMWYLPLAPRLQRLYASPATSSNMRWHAENVPEEGVLIHPSDGEAWKHFDRTYPNFAEETRNVRLGGPVHYRWMYPFERFLHTLKDKVGNKARPEGSICEAYILQETATFSSYYFESHIRSRRTRVPRNDEGCEDQLVQPISIFNQHGRAAGLQRRKIIDDSDSTNEDVPADYIESDDD